MHKKLLIIFISSLVLASCKGTEVTEDMLVGRWMCNSVMTYNTEKTQNDPRNKKIGPFRLTYEKKHTSMTFQYEDLPPTNFTFMLLKDEPYSAINEDIEFKVTHEYIFISNDKFNRIATWSYRNRQLSKVEEVNKETITCVRQ